MNTRINGLSTLQTKYKSHKIKSIFKKVSKSSKMSDAGSIFSNLGKVVKAA